MKRLLYMSFVLILSISLLPVNAFAKINTNDKGFTNYLTEIGMSEDEFLTYLIDMHDLNLEDFDDLEELTDYLGEPLNEENVQWVLDEWDFTQQELEKLLEENGLSLDDYVFIDDLYFELTYLLDEELFTPITDETLRDLLANFGFKSKAELEKFLNQFDDSIENYESIEDLEFGLSMWMYESSKEELLQLMKEFDLTKDEAKALMEHIGKVIENHEAELDDYLTQLEKLAGRMMAFADFDSASELSAGQIAELLDIYNELLRLFELKTEFYLIKDGKTTPISISALMKLETLKDADLLMKIYSLDGKFLADLIITKEMFSSDFVEKTEEGLEKVKDVAKDVVKTEKHPAKTINGGKMPKTANDYIPNTLIGFTILLVGIFLFRKVKVDVS